MSKQNGRSNAQEAFAAWMRNQPRGSQRRLAVDLSLVPSYISQVCSCKFEPSLSVFERMIEAAGGNLQVVMPAENE